jgi:hypothetical protein
VVYKVNAAAGDSIYIDYIQFTTDGSIYIITNCNDPANSCVVGEDSTLTNQHETIAYKFTSAGTYYIIMDSFSAGTGGAWVATGNYVCAPDEFDAFPNSHATVDLLGAAGGETVALNGPSQVNATMRALADGDFDGLEQVPIELVQLQLSGTSVVAGPMTVRLRPASSHPFLHSKGEIEEVANATPGVLDLPPFTPSGLAQSNLDVFVEVDLPALGLLLHNHVPTPMSAVISHKPPAVGETFASSQIIPLYDQNEQPTPWQIGPVRHTPYPPVERDSFPNSKLTVTVDGPLGLETIVMKGPTVVNVDIGKVADSDGDGVEQVPTQMLSMSCSGTSTLYGPVSASLDPPLPHLNPPTLGEIEENANTQAGRLDLPPFAPSGTASSFFDVFFTVNVGGARYHNHIPKHMAGTITHKPPAPGDQYDNAIPVQLFDDNDNPAPFQILRVIHIPNDVKQVGVPIGKGPQTLAIQDIRPNPTTGRTTILCALPARGRTRVAAYDVNGRVVRTLYDGMMEAGVRPVVWDGRGERGEKVPGGVYFIRLESAGRLSVRRVAILR